jgi:hypothetical protein
MLETIFNTLLTFSILLSPLSFILSIIYFIAFINDYIKSKPNYFFLFSALCGFIALYLLYLQGIKLDNQEKILLIERIVIFLLILVSILYPVLEMYKNNIKK